MLTSSLRAPKVAYLSGCGLHVILCMGHRVIPHWYFLLCATPSPQITTNIRVFSVEPGLPQPRVCELYLVCVEDVVPSTSPLPSLPVHLPHPSALPSVPLLWGEMPVDIFQAMVG